MVPVQKISTKSVEQMAKYVPVTRNSRNASNNRYPIYNTTLVNESSESRDAQ